MLFLVVVVADSRPDATVDLPIGVSEVLPWRMMMVVVVVDVMTLW